MLGWLFFFAHARIVRKLPDMDCGWNILAAGVANISPLFALLTLVLVLVLVLAVLVSLALVRLNKACSLATS
jgi:hypothetical protein